MTRQETVNGRWSESRRQPQNRELIMCLLSHLSRKSLRASFRRAYGALG